MTERTRCLNRLILAALVFSACAPVIARAPTGLSANGIAPDRSLIEGHGGSAARAGGEVAMSVAHDTTERRTRQLVRGLTEQAQED
jgi:hypothetical protein